MLKDEFSRLMSLFEEAGEGKPVNLEWLFAETFSFFEHLNLQLKNGTPDQQAEALRMMNEMYAELMKISKKIGEQSGVTEEQLDSASENPGNYTPEHWKMLQEAKSKMGQLGEALIDSVKRVDLPKPEGSKDLFPVQPPPKKDTTPKKPKKSEWMRS